MAGLDFLFNGAPPPSVTSNTVAQQNLPDWYQEYIRGIAGKASDIAGQPYQAYPGQRLADFNDTQRQAFDTVQGGQGAWRPNLTAANDSAKSILPTVQGGLAQASGYGAGAVNSVAGPAAQWTDPGTVSKYMSPYTQQVTDNIARLGNRNLFENIMPQVNDQFIGGGQFGSTRNAEIMGRAIRDTQSDISGQQSLALQSGYNTGAQTFGADANRTQQQGQLQANAGIGAGQLATTGAQVGGAAADSSAQRLGALGQLGQTMNTNDAGALSTIGGQQQDLEQKGYDTGYNEFLNQRNWDWTQLGNVSGAVRGMPLQSGVTQTSNAPAPGAGYGASPLQWATALQGLGQQPQPKAP